MSEKKSALVIVKTETPAFFLNPDGNLVKKGMFSRNRIVYLDGSNCIIKNGIEFNKVLNVRHKNIYTHCNEENSELFKMKHVLSMATDRVKKSGGSDDEVKPQAQMIMREIENKMNAPVSEYEGLSYYTDKAFSEADGFDYIK